MTETSDDTPNEILAAAKAAKAQGKAAAEAGARKASSWPLAKIGLAAGIGSAAISAAVLFARRDRTDA